MATDDDERLLTGREVAARFRVDPKTVARWAAAGRIKSILTPGGHRRYLESEIDRFTHVHNYLTTRNGNGV